MICIVKIHFPGAAPLHYITIAPSTCDAAMQALADYPDACKLSVSAGGCRHV